MTVLRSAFGIIGNVAALAQFLSPMKTFYKIYRKGSTENFSSLPYVVTFINCLMWTWYGLPFVTKHNILVITINVAGVVLQTFYLTIYLIFAHQHKKKLKTVLAFLACCLFFGVMVVITLVLVHGAKRKLFVGILCDVLNTSVYASPLAIMRLVIKTKSVKYMPFLLSLSIFINSISWLIYALLGKDIFILIPNAIGCVLAISQLILYAIYWKQSKESSTTPSSTKQIIDGKPSSEIGLSSRQSNGHHNLQPQMNGVQPCDMPEHDHEFNHVV